MKEDTANQAEIKVTLVVRKVAHLCGSNTPAWEAFSGEVNNLNNDEIIWPVLAGYRIGYCFHCGKKLPHNVGKEKVKL
jgi:hypothetical protein